VLVFGLRALVLVQLGQRDPLYKQPKLASETRKDGSVITHTLGVAKQLTPPRKKRRKTREVSGCCFCCLGLASTCLVLVERAHAAEGARVVALRLACVRSIASPAC
jgi:hypothetical protein